MSQLIGQKVSSLLLPATGNQKVNLSQFKGQNIVIYFYPKDHTPGCTQEGLDFTSYYKKIKKLNTEVFGVSKDSVSSHEKFKTKQKYSFDLISDSDGKLCQFFDVIKEKTLYGRKHLGIERSTFVIDSQGVIVKEWRKVKVEGHVQEVFDFLKTMDS